MSVRVVSVGVATVDPMTSTVHLTSTAHPHACVYFDDGELEVLCACGARAMYLDDAADGLVMVALVTDRSSVTRLHRSVEELAVPA